jgi:hypothetical protein
MNADYWIDRLNLKRHPEGGYYSEVYRNPKVIELVNGRRNLSTSIYFLLKGNDKSHFHQLYSDEIWYFHLGTEVTVHLLSNKNYEKQILGISENAQPQLIIKAGTIFGAELTDKSSFCLMSCMVNPGFEFNDFKLFKANELKPDYPHHEDLIEKFTIE